MFSRCTEAEVFFAHQHRIALVPGLIGLVAVNNVAPVVFTYSYDRVSVRRVLSRHRWFVRGRTEVSPDVHGVNYPWFTLDGSLIASSVWLVERHLLNQPWPGSVKAYPN